MIESGKIDNCCCVRKFRGLSFRFVNKFLRFFCSARNSPSVGVLKANAMINLDAKWNYAGKGWEGNSKFNIFKTIKPEFIVRLRRLSQYCAPFNILHGNQPMFFFSPSTLFFHRALQFFQSIAPHHCTLFIFPINVSLKALDKISFRFFYTACRCRQMDMNPNKLQSVCESFQFCCNMYVENLIETPRLESFHHCFYPVTCKTQCKHQNYIFNYRWETTIYTTFIGDNEKLDYKRETINKASQPLSC